MNFIAIVKALKAFLRDPYRNRLDNMTVEEVQQLAQANRLTVQEVERLHRLALQSKRVNAAFPD